MPKKRTPTVDPLEKKAEQLEQLRESVDQSTFGAGEMDVSDELARVDQHPADNADLAFQRELQLTQAEIIDREAEQVREAMQAKADGTYGVCQDCGKKIPKARLEARPEATLCVDCQRKRETARPA